MKRSTRIALAAVLGLWVLWSALTIRASTLAEIDPFGFYTILFHGLIPALLVPFALAAASRTITSILITLALTLPLLFGLAVAVVDGWFFAVEMWINAETFLCLFGTLFALGFWGIRAMRRRFWAS